LALYDARDFAMLSKISETQRSMLLAAAMRDDHLMTPPTNVRPAAIMTFGGRLIDAGFAKEIKARSGALVWRRDAASGDRYALKLSAKGVKAAASLKDVTGEERTLSVPVAAKDVSTPAPVLQKEALADATASPCDNSPDEVAPTPIRAPRPNSKLGRVLGMLTAEAGVTIGELTALTGWLEHTTRAALTGLRHRGYQLSLTRNERGGVSVYRVAAHSEEAAQ
jgi:hypothetical protein